jgi:hypothetical protein
MLLDAHVPFDYVDSRDFTPENLAHFQVLLLNNATHVSDEELRVMEQFVQSGGRLIVAGHFATEDERSRPRIGAGAQALIPEPRDRPSVQRRGRGVVVYTPLILAPPAMSVLGGLLKLVGIHPIIAGDPRPGLRVNAYADRNRIAVHLVNYRVPKEGDPIPQEGVELRVPLPAKWAGPTLKATWHEPSADSRALPLSVASNEARVVVPRVRIYGVVEIRRG